MSEQDILTNVYIKICAGRHPLHSGTRHFMETAWNERWWL